MSALEIVRLLVGVPLVLLVPGWAWSLAAFPARDWLGRRPLGAGWAPDGAERLAVAVALSIATASLGALAWNGLLRLPLGTWGSLALVAALTGTGVAAWRVRVGRMRRSQPPT